MLHDDLGRAALVETKPTVKIVEADYEELFEEASVL